MTEHEANEWLSCTADACKQGRCPCPCPDACWQPSKKEKAEFVFICAVGCIGFMTTVGLIAGWFA